ncbi:invasion associated locus B family protein [Altererythrobacter sp. MF3-039]|uniref:invasion associated locus B family protein n=1 Tax=Altererythrobacter sp. MF3-039 TaxID=3252901 RepID=UPI00390CB62D
MKIFALIGTLAALCAAPLAARDSLGVFSDWGAFRDAATPRCYAISKPFETVEQPDYEAFASVGTWPLRQVRGQVHFRLSRPIAERSAVTLSVGSRRFSLAAGGGDAWARDPAMDAAIVAAMRSANTMTVRARDRTGRVFSDRYRLAGVASALDAATVACARSRNSSR